MSVRILAGAAVWAAVWAAAGAAAWAATPVALLVPAGPPRSVAVIVSGAEGWTAAHDAAAQALARLDAVAVGVDLPAWLAGETGGCVDAAGALADAAAQGWRAAGATGRVAPTLVGFGAGAGATFAALTQGGRFKGMVTVGFDAVPPAVFCGASVEEGRFALPDKAPALWNEAPLTPGAGADAPMAAALARIDGARFEPLNADGDRQAAFELAYTRIAGTDAHDDGVGGAGAADTADLPLIVHRDPGAPATGLMAVFLSGDGGWAGMDREVADRLAAAGVPVVGVSALRYLWTEKRPEVMAADVARIWRAYAGAMEAERLVLIGFSLGANVTPFYAAALEPDLAARVAGLALIAPEARTGFEFHVGGWLGYAAADHDVAAAMSAAPFPVACLYGDEEAASPCRGRADAQAFAGGHHLGDDHDGIAAAILRLAAESGLAEVAARGR